MVYAERRRSYWVVCHQMVYIVAALPPSDRQTATKVGDEDAYEGVRDEVVRYPPVSGIVGCEHDLLLSQAT